MAVRNVSPYQKITHADVRIENRALVNLNTRPETKTTNVIGQYTRTGLVAGEMVFPGTVSHKSVFMRLSTNERAVAIALNNSGFSIQDLRPGMHVDLVGATQGAHSGTSGGIIASDVRILQVITANSTAPNKIIVAVPVSDATAASQAAIDGNVRVDVVPKG
ncbi:hypothetical protein [Alicyclobacillus sp. SO9]|uniref:hypothetical protein n=1 Tax=Alicyclobacillus sp. SO9 TaxID=2665646 RepID=UPI0018E6F7BE|nr:hypothetical protein [Alicyclobacillus sp. SO9]QQE79703.1 hypothetical protein GI364_04225 [Alicyclobacillus sp. SO9]